MRKQQKKIIIIRMFSLSNSYIDKWGRAYFAIRKGGGNRFDI